MGCHFLLQGIFLTQGSNLGLLHCRWILYSLGHQGSPYGLLQDFEYSSLCYTVGLVYLSQLCFYGDKSPGDNVAPGPQGTGTDCTRPTFQWCLGSPKVGVLSFSFFLWLYHVACGILTPQPETTPVPPAVEAQSLT